MDSKGLIGRRPGRYGPERGRTTAPAGLAGGNANFVFIDGHVENMSVIDPIKKHKWGESVLQHHGPEQGSGRAVIRSRPRAFCVIFGARPCPL